MRVRVPMQGTGAEQLVVVMNSRNGEGAKGLCRLFLLVGQPGLGAGRHVIERPKAVHVATRKAGMNQ
jgi:hypothetical protein